MLEQKTHLKVSEKKVGKPLEIQNDYKAVVELETIKEMVADEYGLVWGLHHWVNRLFCNVGC
jgi:hypothetical protein